MADPEAPNTPTTAPEAAGWATDDDGPEHPADAPADPIPGLAELAAEIGGLREDARRREALLERREAQVRDLSLKLARSIDAVARQRAQRLAAEEQLQQVKGSRFWPLVHFLYVLRRGIRARLLRLRARLRRRVAAPSD
jgi:hypothetical protein